MRASGIFWKFVVTACFGLILSSVILAVASPCGGYELSIYQSTPLPVWAFLILAYVGGASILIKSSDCDGNSKEVSLGFLILLSTNFVLTSLSSLRGYFLYPTADMMNHLSKTMDVISSGSLSGDPTNVYPVTHTLLAQLTLVSSIPLMDLARWIGPILSTLFMIFTYVLARSVSNGRSMFILSITSSSVFVFNYFHTMIYPELTSFYLIPLILYLYFRSLSQKGRAFRLLLIILLIYEIFVYPPTVLVLSFALLAMEIVRCIGRGGGGLSSTKEISITLSLISFASLYQWTSGFEIFDATIIYVIQSLQGVTPHQVLRAQANTAGLSILDTLEYILKTLGADIIYVVLSLVAVVVLIRKRRSVKRILLMLGTFFLVAELIHFSLFLTQFKTPSRLIFATPIYAIAPILVGFVLSELYRRRNKKVVKALALLVIVSTWLIGMLALYHSPYRLQPSLQTTRMDVRGTEFFFAHRDPVLTLRTMGFPFSFPNIVLGDRAVRQMEIEGWYHLSKTAFPEWETNPFTPKYLGYVSMGYAHFSIERLMDVVNETSPNYLILTSRYLLASSDPTLSERGIADRSLYAKHIDIKFVLHEFNNDPTTQIIYSNGEFYLYYMLQWKKADDILGTAIGKGS